jgi:hypothetical protein
MPLAANTLAVVLQVQLDVLVAFTDALSLNTLVLSVHSTPAVDEALPVVVLAGVTETVADAALVPTALVAVTEHEYTTPLVNCVTTIGLAVPLAVRVVPLPVQLAV